jgi:hypothetical protein
MINFLKLLVFNRSKKFSGSDILIENFCSQSQQSETKESKKIITKKVPVDFLDSNWETLIFDNSTYYTANFVEQIKEILPAPEIFKKMRRSEQLSIQKKLVNLQESEFSYKDLVRKSKNNVSVVERLFPEKSEHFHSEVDKLFLSEPRGVKDRPNFIKSNIACVGSMLMEQVAVMFPAKFKSSNYHENLALVESLFSHKTVFNHFVQIAAHESYLNLMQTSSDSTDSAVGQFCVAKDSLVYKYVTFLHRYISSLFIYNTPGLHDLIGDENRSAMFEAFCDSSFSKMSQGSNYPATKGLFQIAHILLCVLEEPESLLYNKRTITGPQGKSHIIYALSMDFSQISLFTLHLPEVAAPARKTSAEFEKGVKRIFGGDSSCLMSEDGTLAMNISQKKRFTIDTNFLSLLKKIDDGEEPIPAGVKLPFPTKALIAEAEASYALRLKKVLSRTKIWILNQIYRAEKLLIAEVKDAENTSKSKKVTAAKRKANRENLLSFSLEKAGISRIEYLYFLSVKKERKKLHSLKLQRLNYDTMTTLAEVFVGYTLYYTDSLDYRTRMYPQSLLFSRVTGFYKYLVTDFSELTLTDSGIKNLFNAYFMSDARSLEANNCKVMKILDSSNSRKRNRNRLGTLFNKVRQLESPGKLSSFLYFKLLELHILSFLKSGRSRVLLEIDQKSSSSVLLSLLVKNKELAERSNLCGGAPRDVYKYLRSRVRELFDISGVCPIKESELFHSFETKKKYLKYSLMCFCYNQQTHGRAMDYIGYIRSDEDIISGSGYKALYKLAGGFPEFLNVVFPQLTEQIELINGCIDFYIEKRKEIEIKTPDGCIVTWSCYLKKDKFSKFKNPYTGLPVGFRIGQEEAELNVKKTKTTFLPGLIHAVDGSVMRKIILDTYRKHKYVVNHLHDSIQISPNYVEELFLTINEIYRNFELGGLTLDYTWFDHVSPRLSDQYKMEFLNYRDRLDCLSSLKKEDVLTFNAKNCYTFED